MPNKRATELNPKPGRKTPADRTVPPVTGKNTNVKRTNEITRKTSKKGGIADDVGRDVKPEDVKRELGRPTNYHEDYAEMAEKLCALGATEFELAQFFKVSTATIYMWRNLYPTFASAVRIGKAPADERVEMALYHRAIGYSHPAEKIFLDREGNIVRAEYTEHYPPDLGAALFWLKNRKPEIWKEKPVKEDGDYDAAKALLKAVAASLPD